MHQQDAVGSEICQTLPVPFALLFSCLIFFFVSTSSRVLVGLGPGNRKGAKVVEPRSVRLPVSCDDDSFPNFAIPCARALIDGRGEGMW